MIAGMHMHAHFAFQMPQATGQMPAMVVSSPPNYDAPHDFFILALVTTIICSILTPISLAFGLPAVFLGVMVSTCI